MAKSKQFMQSPRIEVALLPDDNGDINTPSSLFDIWMILHVPDDKNPEGIRVDGGPYDRNDALQKLSEIWMEVGKRNSPKLHSGGSGIGALSWREFGISLPYSKSGISDDVRLLERGTAAAIIPRHLHR